MIRQSSAYIEHFAQSRSRTTPRVTVRAGAVPVDPRDLTSSLNRRSNPRTAAPSSAAIARRIPMLLVSTSHLSPASSVPTRTPRASLPRPRTCVRGTSRPLASGVGPTRPVRGNETLRRAAIRPLVRLFRTFPRKFRTVRGVVLRRPIRCEGSDRFVLSESTKMAAQDDLLARMRQAMAETAAQADVEARAREEEVSQAKKETAEARRKVREVEAKEKEALETARKAQADVVLVQKKLREMEAERNEAWEIAEEARADADAVRKDMEATKGELELLKASVQQTQLLREKLASARSELEDARQEARGAVEEAERAREEAESALVQVKELENVIEQRDSLAEELHDMRAKARESEDLASVAHAEVAQLLEELNALRAASAAAADEAAIQSSSATEAVLALEKRLRETRDELHARNRVVEELREEIEDLKGELGKNEAPVADAESMESGAEHEDKSKAEENVHLVEQLRREVEAWTDEAAAKQREIERYVELCEKLTRANKALRRQNTTLASNTPQAIALSTPRRVAMAQEPGSPVASMPSLETLALGDSNSLESSDRLTLNSTKAAMNTPPAGAENMAPTV